VSLLNNITVEQLRVLNDLDETCMLAENRKLLIATVVVQPTAAAIPTATSALPSPTPFRGNGEVCVILFNDINGNAVAEDGEDAIPNGAIDISDRLGKVSLTGKTSSSIEEPTCFLELPEGDYNVSVAVPDGYNPTTRMNYSLKVTAGDNTKIDFGAQLNSKAVPTPVTEGGRSPLLGILGAIVSAGRPVAMGFYAERPCAVRKTARLEEQRKSLVDSSSTSLRIYGIGLLFDNPGSIVDTGVLPLTLEGQRMFSREYHHEIHCLC